MSIPLTQWAVFLWQIFYDLDIESKLVVSSDIYPYLFFLQFSLLKLASGPNVAYFWKSAKKLKNCEIFKNPHHFPPNGKRQFRKDHFLQHVCQQQLKVVIFWNVLPLLERVVYARLGGNVLTPIEPCCTPLSPPPHAFTANRKAHLNPLLPSERQVENNFYWQQSYIGSWLES